MAAAQPAPRFYVETHSALLQYKKFKNGTSNILFPEKRKMYAEIFARYESAMNALNNPTKRFYKHIVMEKVLSQPAPCFYLDESTAVKKFYQYTMERQLYRDI